MKRKQIQIDEDHQTKVNQVKPKDLGDVIKRLGELSLQRVSLLKELEQSYELEALVPGVFDGDSRPSTRWSRIGYKFKFQVKDANGFIHEFDPEDLPTVWKSTQPKIERRIPGCRY